MEPKDALLFKLPYTYNEQQEIRGALLSALARIQTLESIINSGSLLQYKANQIKREIAVIDQIRQTEKEKTYKTINSLGTPTELERRTRRRKISLCYRK